MNTISGRRKVFTFVSLSLMTLLIVGCGPKKLEDYAVKPSENGSITDELNSSTETTEGQTEVNRISVLNGDLEIPDYKNLSYSWFDSLSAGEMEEQLDILAKSYAKYQPSEEQSVIKDGDVICVDARFLDCSDDSVLAEVNDYYLTMGTDCAFGEEIVASIVGLDVSTKPKVSVEQHFPGDSSITEVQDKDVRIELIVKSVMTVSVPAITDEWIAEHFEGYTTVDQYLDAVQTVYAEKMEKEAREQAGAYVIDTLCSELLWNNLDNRGSDFTSEKARDAYYALLGVAEAEKITISDEEFNDRLETHREIDSSYQGLSNEEYVKLIGRDNVTEKMLVEKTLEYCIDFAVMNGRQ